MSISAHSHPQEEHLSQSDGPTLTPPLKYVNSLPIDVASSRIRTATAVPDSCTLIAATESNEIIAGDRRVAAPAPVRALAAVRFVTVHDAGLPTHQAQCAVLLEGVGVALYSLPDLQRIEGELADALVEVSKTARFLAADALGGEPVGDSFRIAIAAGDFVSLLSVNVHSTTVETLARTSISHPVVSLAYAGMTIVASTTENHCMLRIGRSSSMALAANVARKDPAVRGRRGSGGGDAGVMSFFGGLFARKENSVGSSNRLAFPLPDNRWVLSIDQEWVTYSSFGMKLEDMENVFKSRMAIDIPESEINAALSVVGSPSRRAKGSPLASVASASRNITRSMSVSSMASANSVATTFTAMTIVDEARASRSEKPAAIATFASPFVLCMTDQGDLLVFAANGSIPGAIETLCLVEEGKQPEPEPGIVPCMSGLCLAILYWPSGRVVEIVLSEDLDTLIEERVTHGELRSALSLVPIDQVDRTILFRRKLAIQARETDWHDASIHHMQDVINLSVARDGVGQVDLIAEAIELRGPKESSWASDPITATLWADFLFRLRRRIMHSSPADVDIIETLCRADVSCTRVKSLLAVKHCISMEEGEAAITSSDCALNEGDRVEALVALYSSLGEHDKALVLLENSGINRAFQTVCSFLTKGMRAAEKPDVFFKHLKWVATESKESKDRELDFTNIINTIIETVKSEEEQVGERMLRGLIPIVVEYTPHKLDDALQRMSISIPSKDAKKVSTKFEEESKSKSKTEGGRKNAKEESSYKSVNGKVRDADVKQGKDSLNDGQSVVESETAHEQIISTDLHAVALLAGMSKADIIKDVEQFEKLRDLFRSQVLHKKGAVYNADRLVTLLQAAQNQSVSLHQELAFLLGLQGRHEAAAMELAAETSMSTVEATQRLEKLLPSSDRSSAAQALVTAYLQVSGGSRLSRVQCAAELVQREGGTVDVEKVLGALGSSKGGNQMSLTEMKPFLQAALITGNERVRLAEVLHAMRASEVRRVRDEVLMRRRRCVMIGDERACSICTRRIGDSVFAAYPDGSVTHLVCHMSLKR